jgi:RecT family
VTTTTNDDPNLPAAKPDMGSLLAHLGGNTMSPAMAIMLDERLFERVKQIAVYMSRAVGFVPPHLINKSEACFAVVSRSLTWKLDPFAVAQCTYQTPGGRVGYEGKLCQAILENSGYLVGPVKYTHLGDWSQVMGKFEIRKGKAKEDGSEGKEYPHRTWERKDAKGLSVVVKALIRGEEVPREWPLDLEQCFPLNSTLWATDPKKQICYTAVRGFANLAVPGLMMGVPFDRTDDDDDLRPERAKDVTPPPRKSGGKDKLATFVETHTAAKTEPQPPSDLDAKGGFDETTGEIDQQQSDQRQADEPAQDDKQAQLDVAPPQQEGMIPIRWPDDKIKIEDVQPVWYGKDAALAVWKSKSHRKTGPWILNVLNNNPELKELLNQEQKK